MEFCSYCGCVENEGADCNYCDDWVCSDCLRACEQCGNQFCQTCLEDGLCFDCIQANAKG